MRLARVGTGSSPCAPNCPCAAKSDYDSDRGDLRGVNQSAAIRARIDAD
jgi:hypothetical protein